jgi:molybdate-binding protein
MERGRGTALTVLGEDLATGMQALEAQLEPQLRKARTDLERLLKGTRTVVEVPLRVRASHDFALDRLAEALPRHGGPGIELAFQGSLDALASLNRSRCDVAGFHVPMLPGRQPLLEPFRPALKARTLKLVHFADRTQGLIVAKGNPLQIASLRDLARRPVRFVNRQGGSGTRLFFDALLAAHRIRPAQIVGYRHEEFTHGAVAAMIASGSADAAFGIEAAAARHGLSFVPMAQERYFLAMRTTVVARPAMQALLNALQSRWFRSFMRDLPGYAMPTRRTPVPVAEAFERLSA